jgi:hypothetical protein
MALWPYAFFAPATNATVPKLIKLPVNWVFRPPFWGTGSPSIGLRHCIWLAAPFTITRL